MSVSKVHVVHDPLPFANTRLAQAISQVEADWTKANPGMRPTRADLKQFVQKLAAPSPPEISPVRPSYGTAPTTADALFDRLGEVLLFDHGILEGLFSPPRLTTGGGLTQAEKNAINQLIDTLPPLTIE